jgi:hypothetical protein
VSFIDDDLALIYSEGTPGVDSFTFTIGGTPSTVYGFYAAPGATISVEAGQIQTTAPSVRVLSSAVSSFNKKNDTITISGTAYTALEVMPTVDGKEKIFLVGRD